MQSTAAGKEMETGTTQTMRGKQSFSFGLLEKNKLKNRNIKKKI